MAESIGGERRIPPSPFGPAGTKVLVAPFQLWLDGADALRLEGWASAANVTLQLYGRVLLDDGTIGTIQTSVAVPSTTARAAIELQLAKGFLLSVVVVVTGTTARLGEVFMRLSLMRGFTGAVLVMGTLLQGYVTASQAQAWPGTPLQQTDGIDGFLQNVTIPAGAAGSPVSVLCPTGRHWIVQTIGALLNTDATVINRRPYVWGSAPANFISHHTGVTPASTTRNFYWANGMATNIDTASIPNTAALPVRWDLDEGQGFVMGATNLQAGDQFQGSSMSVLERLTVT